MRLAVLPLLAVLAGCSCARVEEPEGPVLIHLPGIQGASPVDHFWTQSLINGGLDVTVEQFDWTAADKWMVGALQQIDRNREEAARLAARITQLRQADPKRRIILTSHSGGSGFAVFALEQLPPDVKVDTFVMLAPALSPDYDLSPALAHVRDSAYAFSSKYDMWFLGAGTRAFGTMDGQRVSSAGYVGFTPPERAQPQEYAKLVQLSYQTSWMRYAYFGDHIGILAPRFGEYVIGPLLDTGMLPQ